MNQSNVFQSINKRKSEKGLLSFDGLFSILPVLLLLLSFISLVDYLMEQSTKTEQQQILFDKLLSAGDYAVKQGMSKKIGSTAWPNLVESLDYHPIELEKLKIELGFNKLLIGPDKAEGMTCIYRLVVLDDLFGRKEIKKIYICGE